MLKKEKIYELNGLSIRHNQEDVIDEKPVLDDGEEYCPKCGGNGFEPDQDLSNEWLFICYKCNGAGKVDWIKYTRGLQKED